MLDIGVGHSLGQGIWLGDGGAGLTDLTALSFSVSSSRSDKLVIVSLGHLVEFFLTKMITWVIDNLPAVQQCDFLEGSSSSSMTASSTASASAYSTTVSNMASPSMTSAVSSTATSSGIIIASLAYFTNPSCGTVTPRNSSDGILRLDPLLKLCKSLFDCCLILVNSTLHLLSDDLKPLCVDLRHQNVCHVAIRIYHSSFNFVNGSEGPLDTGFE